MYNTKSFIEKAKNIHFNKYCYDKTIFVIGKLKVIITCPIHGDFIQRADAHLEGYGCPKCSKRYKLDSESFIEYARYRQSKYNRNYTYEKVIYKHSKIDVIITCPIHGDFLQRPDHHIQGRGCPKCHTKNKYKNK